MSNLMDKFVEKERPTVSPRSDGFSLNVCDDDDQTDSVATPGVSSPTNSTSSKNEVQQDIPLLEIDKQGKLVRLEKQVQSEILALCAAEGITLEVFLESAWVSLKNNQKLTDKVLKEAKQRRELRKELGNLRRFETGQRKSQQRLAKLRSK